MFPCQRFDARQYLAHPCLAGVACHDTGHARMVPKPVSPVKKKIMWQRSHGQRENAHRALIPRVT